MNGRNKEIVRLLLTPVDMLNWMRVKNNPSIRSDEWVILCNCHIGETYLTCGLLEAFSKSHDNAPVSVIIDKNYEPIADLFPFISRKIIVNNLPAPFTAGLMANLYKPRRGIPFMVSAFGGFNYKGLNFLDSFKLALNLDPDAKFSAPRTPNEEELSRAVSLLQQNGLRPGKTAILFPGARSTKALPQQTWVNIAKRLKELGWDVANSIIGYDDEIEGAVSLKIPIKDLHATVQSAGWFIALRSGICEFMSSVNCKKTILYPKYRDYYYQGEFRINLNKFRMLSGLGLPNTKKLKEFEIEPELPESEIKKIIR